MAYMINPWQFSSKNIYKQRNEWSQNKESPKYKIELKILNDLLKSSKNYKISIKSKIKLLLSILIALKSIAADNSWNPSENNASSSSKTSQWAKKSYVIRY